MKLNRSMLVAVAMMVGSLSAMGCKQSSTQASPAETAPAQVSAAADESPATPAPAPALVKAAPATARVVLPAPAFAADPSDPRFISPAAPPVVIEVPGPAPTGDEYVRADYVRVNGRWERRVDRDGDRRYGDRRDGDKRDGDKRDGDKHDTAAHDGDKHDGHDTVKHDSDRHVDGKDVVAVTAPAKRLPHVLPAVDHDHRSLLHPATPTHTLGPARRGQG